MLSSILSITIVENALVAEIPSVLKIEYGLTNSPALGIILFNANPTLTAAKRFLNFIFSFSGVSKYFHLHALKICAMLIQTKNIITQIKFNFKIVAESKSKSIFLNAKNKNNAAIKKPIKYLINLVNFRFIRED